MTVAELKKILEHYPDDMVCVNAPCLDAAMFDIEVEEYEPTDGQRYYGCYGNDSMPKVVLKFT
jgi:hypothetical protein